MSSQDAPRPTGFGLTRVREPVEAAFGRYGHFVYRRAWWIIAAVALCNQHHLV